MTTPKYIALLSIEPNSSTATIIQEIRHMGHQPLVITSRDKMCKLKDKCLEHCIDVPEIVAISSLHNGKQSVEELVTAMGSYPMIDWLSGKDQSTPLYLG